jgi:hypothetical protein
MTGSSGRGGGSGRLLAAGNENLIRRRETS